MKRVKSFIRFIHRKRHGAGFGVHSPFAFNLILETINTSHSYYIYEENRKIIDNAGLEKKADLKYAELIYRLINRFNSKDILEIGSGLGINTLYMNVHSEQTTLMCVEQDENKSEIARLLLANKMKNIIFTNTLPTKKNSFDAVFWDLMQYPLQEEETLNSIYNTIKSDGFIVVNHISHSLKNKKVWQEIIQLDELTMGFDLGAIGIGFFKPSLPKLNYDLYYKHRNGKNKY